MALVRCGSRKHNGALRETDGLFTKLEAGEAPAGISENFNDGDWPSTAALEAKGTAPSEQVGAFGGGREMMLADSRTADNEVSNDGDLFHEISDPTLL